MAILSQSRQPAFAIKRTSLILAGLLLLVPVAWWRYSQTRTGASVFEPAIQPIQSEPLCPWRQPDEDLKQFFPQATRYQVETRILSGLRPQLTQELGRTPTGGENALQVNRVFVEQTPVGVILTRRVKGNYGAVELVVAVGSDGQVRGLRVQREREPEEIAKVIESPTWLASFAGKSVKSRWRLGDDVPAVSPEARASAEAIVDGTRSLLILLNASEQAKIQTVSHH